MLDIGVPSRLRFRLLGPAQLMRNDTGAVRISAQKGFALLAYLATHQDAPVSRALLADLLWGDRIDAKARQNLRQLILTLRRDLSPQYADLLQADDQSLSFLVHTDDVDALQFETWAKHPDRDVRQQCLELPWGPFLDGFSVGSEAFDEWVTTQRHRLDALAVRTFAELADHAERTGDGERAILAMERLITIDPAEEERHRRLLSLEARYRGADAALARSRELAAMLKREFDAECEPATTALIKDIRRNAKTPTDVSPPLGRSADDGPAPAIAAEMNVAGTDAKYDRAAWWHWLPRKELLGRRGAGLLASLALAMGCAALFWTINSKPMPSGAGDRSAVVAPAADPWQSPPLPSGRVAGGGAELRKGIIPIVVLPFKTYEDVGSVRMIADMMTDDVTNMLSRVRNFRVISRQTARSYHMQQHDVADAGHGLGVRYALEGSVRMLGNTLRVTIELTDTASRSVVWSARIEREDADRYGVQDEVVRRLVRELQVGSLPIEAARQSKDADADTLAYQGMAALFGAFTNINLEAYQKAEALFLQALERDPQSIMARLGLGSFHANVAVQRLVDDPDSHLEKAHEIITGVIRQVPAISGAHHQLGIILQNQGKLKEAIEAFERAIELNPSSAGSYAHIGFALARMMRAAEGLEHIRYAMRLSPRDPSLAIWLEFAGAANLELGQYREASDDFHRSISLTPDYPRPWAGLVASQALAGEIDAARLSVERLRKLGPNLTARQLFQRFGRLNSHSPRLQEGLWRVLAETAGSPTIEKSWQSPSLPSKAANDPIARSRGLVAIAVLPFRTYSENGDSTGLVADMVTEDLTYLLSRIPVFRVISHQTANSYRAQSDAATTGTELGVHYLVEGNISMRGNIVRVHVALVDTKTRLQIWSSRFERTGDDRHAMQQEVVRGLARELQVSVETIESDRTSANPNVHELIFKGFSAIQETGLAGVEALRPAEGYFLKAIERDPNAVRAQVGLAAFHAQMAVQLFAPDPAPHLAKAEAILEHVIARHPDLSDAYRPMGLVHVARGHMKKAMQSFERAVELNPSDAPAYAQIGRALVSLGHPQAGLDNVLYAMQLSPRDPNLVYWLAFAGSAALELTRYDEAIGYLARAYATNPTQPRTALTYIAALAMGGRMSEARLRLEELQNARPHLSRERLLRMYSGESGRIQTTEGVRRVLAATGGENFDAIK